MQKQQEKVLIKSDTDLPTTYFDLMNKVGSGGLYQKKLFCIMYMIYFVTGSILLGTSFLFFNNQYVCQELGLLVSGCKKSVCQIQNKQQRQSYFLPNQQNIESIATDYGPFMCQDQFFLDMLQSCPYLGSLIGFLVFSYVSDNFGRKTTMVISLSISAVGCILIVLKINLALISIGVIVSGAGMNVSASIIFYFFAQTIEHQKRQKYSTIVQSGYTLGVISITGLYYFLHNWRIISLVLQAGPVIIILGLFIFYVQQTPMFLLKTSDNKKALKALNRIGQINYGYKNIVREQDLDNVRKCQQINEESNKDKVSILDLLRFPSLRFTTIVACLMCYAIFTMYFGPALMIDTIGFNTYVSSIVIQLSQLLCYIPCYYYIDKMQRKRAALILFSISIVSTLILSFVQKPENCKKCPESVIQIIVIFFFRFSITAYYITFLVYIVQLFPTKIVGLGVGAINSAGNTASTLSPIILGALQRIQFNLMLFFLIFSIFGLSLSILLKETYGTRLQTDIDETVEQKSERKISNYSVKQIKKLNKQNKIK